MQQARVPGKVGRPRLEYPTDHATVRAIYSHFQREANIWRRLANAADARAAWSKSAGDTSTRITELEGAVAALEARALAGPSVFA